MSNLPGVEEVREVVEEEFELDDHKHSDNSV